jgi:hypothetical protein
MRRWTWVTKPATARTPGRIIATAPGTTIGPIRSVLTSPEGPPTGCKIGSVSSLGRVELLLSRAGQTTNPAHDEPKDTDSD